MKELERTLAERDKALSEKEKALSDAESKLSEKEKALSDAESKLGAAVAKGKEQTFDCCLA